MNTTKLSLPRIMICATSSGSGKTMISCCIMELLKKRGLETTAFKCGPDYIDPMFHKKVLGIPSRNLDLFLAGEQGLLRALLAGGAGRDIAVIEGVMGFFDGQSAVSMEGSTYDIAGKTGTPSILVVDAKGMSRSVVPVVKGFCDYAGSVIKGIILNRMSPMIYKEIKEQIEKEVGVPVLGFLPRLKDITLTDRHLGLVMPDEIPDILGEIDRVADKLAESLDVDRLIEIAKTAPAFEVDAAVAERRLDKTTTVGVALDEAFCFYYEDNLELLKEMGAELKFFSPIHDKKLPEVDRIIIGGGYPELHARELSENKVMLADIKQAAESGMPILAECGGFLYLQEELTDTEGKCYPMAGVFKGKSHMTDKLSHFGYVNVEAAIDNPFLRSGEVMRGHEFHYYDTSDNGEVLNMTKPSGKRSWTGYQLEGKAFGGFAHLYYRSFQEFAWRFLNS